MPVLRVDAIEDQVALFGADGSLDEALRARLADLPLEAPVVIMLHGFKYSTRVNGRCPHLSIFGEDEACAAWPHRLGLGDAAQGGLGIAFSWHARGPLWRVYRRAAITGRALAALINRISRIAPARRINIVAHSMGTEVALRALPHVEGTLHRIISLTGASYQSTATAMLNTPAGRRCELVNIVSRDNDLFDFMFERMVRPPVKRDRPIGHGIKATNAVTIELDNPLTLERMRAGGWTIAPPLYRISHWSCYLRAGSFDFYRAIVQDPARITLNRLRQLESDEPTPVWSRLFALPALPALLPFGTERAS